MIDHIKGLTAILAAMIQAESVSFEPPEATLGIDDIRGILELIERLTAERDTARAETKKIKAMLRPG